MDLGSTITDPTQSPNEVITIPFFMILPHVINSLGGKCFLQPPVRVRIMITCRVYYSIE
jgi:hypothetical protein